MRTVFRRFLIADCKTTRERIRGRRRKKVINFLPVHPSPLDARKMRVYGHGARVHRIISKRNEISDRRFIYSSCAICEYVFLLFLPPPRRAFFICFVFLSNKTGKGELWIFQNWNCWGEDILEFSIFEFVFVLY